MNRLRASFTVATLLAHVCASCSDESPASVQTVVATPITTRVTTLVATPYTTPASAPSSLPNFASTPDGHLYLSWVSASAKPDEESEASLHFARVDATAAPADASTARSSATPRTLAREIARGDHWFVNWADFPAFAALDDRHLIASFLERTGASTYDYAVRIVGSTDGGATWTAPITLHSDDRPGEHGFVSLAALADQRFAAVWLDSRNMQGGEHGAHQGAMSLYLRTVETGATGITLGPETLLDDRVCDCCQTALAPTSDGALLVAYRDRSAGELRDISLLRIERDGTNRTVFTSADGWKIAGCPVNGPALDVAGDRVALAWFTLGRDGLARVLCVISEDKGSHFGDPITIAQGSTQGRVDAMFDAGGALVVTWLEAGEQHARWLAARVEQTGQASSVVGQGTIAETENARSSGFGRLGRAGEDILFAFTAASAPPGVKLMRIAWH